VISLATIRQVELESGLPLDIRRFRPNIVLETFNDAPLVRTPGWARGWCSKMNLEARP
jgi:uncharacterized protein YcbX